MFLYGYKINIQLGSIHSFEVGQCKMIPGFDSAPRYEDVLGSGDIAPPLLISLEDGVG
jgi:hypothetical protein